jgi:SAM-dependent methyltransferase
VHASKQWEYLFVWHQLTRHFKDGCSGLRIADMAGGRGALSAYLAAKGAIVDLIDLDYLWDHRGDLKIEGRSLRWVEKRNYRAAFGSLFNLPADDETFDVVTLISAVEHVKHKACALKEALRILKPGGLLIVTFDFALDPDRHRDELRKEIFSSDSLDLTLGLLSLPPASFSDSAVAASARQIQEDKVLGIPDGMTVAGIVIGAPLPPR